MKYPSAFDLESERQEREAREQNASNGTHFIVAMYILVPRNNIIMVLVTVHAFGREKNSDE